MTSDHWVLGVDVGTSRSAGAMANGTVTPLEVEGNRWMPSMVLLDPAGHLVVGAAADNQAGVYPERVERTPKRYIGSPAPLLLGGHAVPVQDAISRLIEVFVREGKLRAGGANPVATVLTHPVRWGQDRIDALGDAARALGLTDVMLIEEPVAAAAHYVGDRVEVGRYVAVYDLGGGTFDTAVLRRTPDGFETVGAPGGDEFIGGEHIDHLVYEFLGRCLADDDPDLWEQVQVGEERRWTRAAADLLAQARRAKEAVSVYPSTQVVLPLVDRDVVFSRVQLEEMIRDLIEQTVDEMAGTIASAGLVPADLEAIYLVGGSSRIPLVSELMHARFGDRIATRDEPKSVVALGAATVGRHHHNGRASTTGDTGAADVAEPVAHEQLWQLAFHSPPKTVTTGDGAVLVVDESDHLHRIDASGTWHWQAGLPGPCWGAPAVVAGRVVAGCASPNLGVINWANGAALPSWTASAPIIVGPVATRDLVLTIGEDGRLTAYGLDGVVRWILPVNATMRAPLVIFGDQGLVACMDGSLYRFATASGVVSWGFTAPAPLTAPPLVVGDVALVGCTDGVIYGVDLATGHARWTTPVGGPVDGQLVWVDDRIVAADRSGTITALHRDTGQIITAVRPGGTFPTGLVMSGAHLHADNGDGTLISLDPMSLAVVAQSPIPTGSWLPPAPLTGAVVVRHGPAIRALRVPD